MIAVSLMMAVGSAVFRSNDCGKHEISCADVNETCILRTQECDGEVNCPDASDEQIQRCRNTGRPMLALAFHCSNHHTRNLYTTDLCHPLCFRLRVPDLCFYAMMSIDDTPVGTCSIPSWPDNGSYEVEATSYTDMTLFFTCNRGYDLLGHENPSCAAGEWRHEIPTCKPLSGWAVADEDLR